MTESYVLYVDAVVIDGDCQIIGLTRLLPEEVSRKRYLMQRIIHELDALYEEFRDRPDQLECYSLASRKRAFRERVVPLQKEYNNIGQQPKLYVVRGGRNYQMGDVLDEVPPDAEPMDESE